MLTSTQEKALKRIGKLKEDKLTLQNKIQQIQQVDQVMNSSEINQKHSGGNRRKNQKIARIVG